MIFDEQAIKIPRSLISKLRSLRPQVGVLKVRLFRPWDRTRFMAALPTTCKRICVLDRTKDCSQLEVLYLYHYISFYISTYR